MKKIRLYFDTSVFGGIHDVEFKQETELLFEMVKNNQVLAFILTCVNWN